jgi:Sec-independent protein translocase protein TatA
MGWSLGGIGESLGSMIGAYKDTQAADQAKKASKANAEATLEAAQHNSELSLYDARVTRDAAQASEIQTNAAIAQKSKKLDEILGAQRAKLASGGVVL